MPHDDAFIQRANPIRAPKMINTRARDHPRESGINRHGVRNVTNDRLLTVMTVRVSSAKEPGSGCIRVRSAWYWGKPIQSQCGATTFHTGFTRARRLRVDYGCHGRTDCVTPSVPPMAPSSSYLHILCLEKYLYPERGSPKVWIPTPVKKPSAPTRTMGPPESPVCEAYLAWAAHTKVFSDNPVSGGRLGSATVMHAFVTCPVVRPPNAPIL